MLDYKLISYGNCLTVGNYVLHSQFKQIVNFINAVNQIVSVATNVKFLHANSIIVQEIELKNIEKIEINNYELIIKNYKLHLDKKLEFNSKLDFEIKNSKNLFNDFENKYLHLFKEKSLVFLLNQSDQSIINPSDLVGRSDGYKISAFETAMQNHLKSAYSEIISGNIIQGISKFKGVGYGLTPSGDDFIAGFLYGLNILEIEKSADYSDLISEILKTSLGNNIISNNLLILASKGLFFSRLKNLIECILMNQEDKIENTLEELFEVGETSGSDILVGILTALKIS